jgi:hypothetical protein
MSGASLTARLLARVAERPDATALIFVGDHDAEQRFSFAELLAESGRLAALLATHGIRRGDVVLIALPASPEQVFAFRGVLFAGATPSLFPYPRPNGLSLFRGRHKDGSNHLELHLAALRDGVDTLSRRKWPHACGDAYRREVAERIGRFLGERTTPHAVFSNEGLSLLRHPDELERLAALLGAANEPVRIILYLRNRGDFLRAYETQIRKVRARVPSTDPGSALYVGPDAWTADFDALAAAYASCFGHERIIVLESEDLLAEVAGGIDALPHLASYRGLADA